MRLRFTYKIVVFVIALLLQLAVSQLVASGAQQPDKSPLYEAAMVGDVSKVKALIEDGFDVNVTDDCGRTALIEASRRGYDEIVYALLAAGADVNAQTGAGFTLDYRVKHMCPLGYTALSEAAQRGHQKTVHLLLKAGADVGSNSKALRNAAGSGHQVIVRMLLDAGHEIDVKDALGGTALSVSAMMGHADIVRILLDAGADVGGQSEALSKAALHGHKEIVRMLLEADHDIEARYSLIGYSPLEAAARAGHNEIVRMLLVAGADINAQGKLSDSKNILPGVDPDAPALTALMLAVSAGHNQTVRILLDNGADIEAKSYYGTALGLAASKSHLEIVKMLLDAGTDVDAQDVRGRTALSMTRDPKIISILNKYGAGLKGINTGLLRDLGAIIPSIASVLVGMFAVCLSWSERKNKSINPYALTRMINESYLYYFNLFCSLAFVFAYLGLILFWFAGSYVYSQYFGGAAAIFLLILLSTVAIVWLLLMVGEWRQSWRIFWFSFAGLVGPLLTATDWVYNHSIELIFS